MKLDKRGFPTKPMPSTEWAAFALANVAPEDLADFFNSQARLHQRKAKQYYALGAVLIFFFAINLLSLVIDLMRGAS